MTDSIASRLVRITAVLLLGAVPAAPAAAGGLVNPFIALPWATTGNQFQGQFGFDAATAGDVNGDGFSDVLVGAFLEDNTHFDEGRTHLFLGSAEGLQATVARRYTTAQDTALGGFKVAPAGDVNGDGFADFAISVILWNTPTHADAGKVMIFHGGTNIPFVPNYSLLSPTPAESQHFGRSLAPAGDVNGDGYDDLLVGTQNFTVGGFTQAGIVFVFHGGPNGLAAAPALTWTGAAENGYFGSVVSTAGDVNGDGFADVIIGAPQASVGFLRNGAAHLYLGSASGASATVDTVIVGTAANEYCGSGVANAGDVNGDGYADVLIGCPGFNTNVGQCRLVQGGPFGLGTGSILVNPEALPNEYIGARVATLGDLDGDGFADFGVTARNTPSGGRGRISVFRGGRNAVTYMGDLLTPNGPSGYFGNSLATAGDTNGDGFSEILVGTEDWSVAPGWYEGKAFLYAAPRGVPQLSPGWPRAGAQPGTGYGAALALLPKTSGDIHPLLALGDPGFGGFGRVSFHPGGIFNGIGGNERNPAILGTINAQNLGARLADVGDVNRDGYSDLLVASTTLDNGPISQAGRVDFHPGEANGLLAPSLVLVGDRDFDRVGSALGGRGDVNGDGYHDFVIGAREWDSASLDGCGKAWLFLGSPTGPVASTWTREGVVAGAGLGAAVALTDLDGDGYSDIVVGSSAPASAALPPPGVVEVFYGAPDGPATTPGLTFSGPDPDVSFGATVAAIGDVTGDQVADLGVAAPLQDNLGRVSIYAGSLGRSQRRSAIKTYTGSQPGGRFGAAIAGGGDVDGDGRGDFVIGSPGFDSALPDDGRVDLYRGASELLPATPHFSFSPGITGGKLGECISPLLDANLDGFADMVVGAPGAAGRVYCFMGGSGPGHMAAVTLYEPNIGNRRRIHPALIDDPDEVQTDLLFASPGGRSRIGVEFEVATQNTPFTGIPTQSTGLIYDSDAPDEGAGLLSSVIRVFPRPNLPWPGGGYHLRARFVTRSPFFPRSRWMAPEAHTSGDLDIRTSGAVVDALIPPGPGEFGLRGVVPNPSPGGDASRLSFVLARTSRVQLDLYDVRGALVRRLLDEDRAAGPSTVAWDGRDDSGRAVAAGLYFLELRAGGRADRGRVVRLTP